MARIARAVAVGVPYHVTHRGNHRCDVFVSDADRREYLIDLADWSADRGLEIWGWCLMSNHLHLIAVPRCEDALARAIGRVHQRHARRVNALRGWTGHLWANRFCSTPLDEARLWTAIKYVELNPVRAGLARRAEDWPWSSARAHAGLAESGLLAAGRPFGGRQPHPLTGRPLPWADWLALGEEPEAIDRLRLATRTGRPCGSESFVQSMESQLRRPLAPQKRGPKPGRKGDPEEKLTTQKGLIR